MKIENYKFGEIKIGGKVYTRDIKIFGEKIFPNWWRKEGHYLYKQDIDDILGLKPDYLIIGTGAYGVMKVDPELKEYLNRNNITYFILDTSSAVKKYNQLIQEGKKVGGCFHLTC